MKLHNKLAKALLRKKDFLSEMGNSKSIKRMRRAKKIETKYIEYVYTNNELEFILNKGLRDITYNDIMSDPLLFLMVSEESLQEWLDLHKVDNELFLNEYRQVEIVSNIAYALDMYFDDDFIISNDELKSYGEFSKIDKIILKKLYLRSLFVENKKEKTFTIKAKNKFKRCTKISIAKELYHLLCNDKTKEEASKYIEEIRVADLMDETLAEHNFVVWLMTFVRNLWKQNGDHIHTTPSKDEEVPFWQ